MLRRVLGHSQIEVSAIGLGTLHFGVFLDARQSARLVHRALDLGIDFFDTAPIYGGGRSEAMLGEALRGRRHRAVVTSKVGLEPRSLPDGSFGVRASPLTPATVRDGIERSLAALSTDYLDLYQLHAFDPDNPAEEVYACLDDLVREGKIRAYGCSNHSASELSAAVDACDRRGVRPPTASQVHFNLVERRVAVEKEALCRRHRIGLICNRALARGILAGKYAPGAPPPPGSRGEGSWRVRRWLVDDTLHMVADLDAWAGRRGRRVAELAIAWLLARPSVSAVLVGARDEAQLGATVRGWDWSLSSAELAEVEAVVAAHRQTETVHRLPETHFET